MSDDKKLRGDQPATEVDGTRRDMMKRLLGGGVVLAVPGITTLAASAPAQAKGKGKGKGGKGKGKGKGGG